jgi:hypothetical protein
VSDGAPEQEPQEAMLPGVPLDTGFEYQSKASTPGAVLSEEARTRVLKMIESVERSRLIATEEGRTSYVG